LLWGTRASEEALSSGEISPGGGSPAAAAAASAVAAASAAAVAAAAGEEAAWAKVTAPDPDADGVPAGTTAGRPRQKLLKTFIQPICQSTFLELIVSRLLMIFCIFCRALLLQPALLEFSHLFNLPALMSRAFPARP
jgi:hypothetical protein